MVKRADRLRFFGGFWAFPGGKVDDKDGNPGDTISDRTRNAAVRELFEECGVLLARKADGSFPRSSSTLDHYRRELLSDRISFHQLLNDLQLKVLATDMPPVGNLVTPPFTALRFDSTFYLAEMPEGQLAEVWNGELVEGRWVKPGEMVEEWLKGLCLIAPPTLTLLQGMRNRPTPEWPLRLSAQMSDLTANDLPPIFFAPDVQLLPLRTVALPPSTHTNAYLVGRDPTYLLDPGSKDAEEQSKLFEALDLQLALGRRLQAIVLTHHHPDHVGAATICAERYKVPIWAHPQTANLLSGKIRIDRAIHDQEQLDLGLRPDQSGPWYLQALHTPGHASGHLAFYDSHYRLLFAGDLVSTQTSMIIAPPDGDLSIYLDSLKRVQALDCRLLLPSHGSPTAQPVRLFEEALALRAKREQQILNALIAGPRPTSELMEEVYRGVPTELTRYAELQLQAGLMKLHKENKAEPVSESPTPVWRLCQANKTF
jgi:ribonuclease/clavin/mitogillin